ncbi:octaprenyl-diphosphate synthase [Filimonas lacunae]|uniref:Octaprenyl-diphosphate synthase n=1 Tax=Filimonas lacunae TaxID=477680 RepID=A0A173MR67_9BACT|nr:polyprenyl synthetase family protein [Filimonas lacunae]BAV09871.1 trans-hexaprenyltranstransferase [Filimonas lacunae]SIS80269.1 octaprenyl-diphosphate synthase [Filimonas lacunae]
MQLTRTLLEQELLRFEEYYQQRLSNNVGLLNSVLQYLEKQKGKQMRPMFVLLCAKLGGGINEQSYRAALLVEMLHTASLVHDDMVDDSMLRRNAFSVNALWKNRIAVLTGDYLFSDGLVLSLSNRDEEILRTYSNAIRQMIEAELLQMVKSKKIQVNEQAYYELINAKTASFLAAACAAGARSSFTDEELIKTIHLFGEKAGMAFQLKDDLFDYGNAAIGKPVGNDIKERKITLPLIYTLNTCSAATRKKLMHILQHHNTNKDKVDEVVAEVVKAGGMDYAERKMYAYRDEALALLYTFPVSDTRAALEEMVRYTTDRSY